MRRIPWSAVLGAACAAVFTASPAAGQAILTKTLTTAPAHLDLPESYRLRIAVPDGPEALALTAIGPVVDTLPPGAVFSGATPAADCQPGCIGTTPTTVTWASPCAVPLDPGESCDVVVHVTFPSASFASGSEVTNSFTVDATPTVEPPVSFGPEAVTHAVSTFAASPSVSLAKAMAGGTPNPPALNQTFSYELTPANDGNVPLDNVVMTDLLPVELQTASVTTGAYTGLGDFAAGEGVRVSYEKNTALGVFTLWGSSPSTGANTTLTAPPPGLGAGEHVTRIRWELGQAQPGMAASAASSRPRITGRIIDPDNAGGPVTIGDTVENCAELTAVYTAGPSNVSRNACRSFVLSGPFAQLNPAKENLSGGAPFSPGQQVSFRLRVRSAPQSSDAVPLEDLVATDLLPVDLVFSTWSFDALSTGRPAPQGFEQIPNFAGTGRTLLRWRWNAGSGQLGVGQQVWIDITATIRNGARAGNLANDFTLAHEVLDFGLRCSGSSQVDALDLDGDGNSAETRCRATGSVAVAATAQLVASKTIEATCDSAPVASSAGTLSGGGLEYLLRVQNVGTVAMHDLVLVDILPFVGDTGVRDTSPRGSLWTPLLAAPISAPPGTTVFYSTSGNPCRGEVGGPTTGCDPAGWSTVPPEPISATRSIKVEFGGRVVAPFDLVELGLAMVTPADVPPGAPAFNSFAYRAARADGLGSLAEEPAKVGVELGTCDAAALGDRVWVDADGDGTRDGGETGLDDVLVRLLAPGGDGAAATADDVPLGRTRTAIGPGGEAGWYRFPALAPGDYLVCVEPPPTFLVTAPDVGGDDGADSDLSPATRCTPVVQIAADEERSDLDAGLVPTGLAALGGLVWFDRDGDGMQNEPELDGANGVTVRLHLDDGDSVPEPGTGDALVAATVTVDDVHGRPGHYLFDGVGPDVPYFVEVVLPGSATGFTTAGAGTDDTVDSDVGVAGTSGFVTLAAGEARLDVDAGLAAAGGTQALGDRVWADTDDDGVFEPEDGEQGIDGVRLDLYLDADGDGLPTLGEHRASTETATVGGFSGRYRFESLAAGSYVVVVAPSSLGGGGALAGLVSSAGNDPAPDPDDDVDGDDNGRDLGALIATLAVTLTDNGEPTSEDGDSDTNLTLDLGFSGAGPPPAFDYGDASDTGGGSGAGDYATTAHDDGPHHRLGDPGGPWLGACVDGDDGAAADAAAAADDLAPSGLTLGTCATAGDDEDGVEGLGTAVMAGGSAELTVTATGACILDAWVDWDRSGIFGDSAGEQVANGLLVSGGAPAVLTPAVPVSALPGLAVARFRCSVAGGLSPTGPADSGEVEDHLLSILGLDFGDAPSSYATAGAGAASHGVDALAAPLHLGACVDTEVDGEPTTGADGDDLGLGTRGFGACVDDEDGVAFLTLPTACQTAQLAVTASRGGVLDAWVDFNADGDFDDAGERIAAGEVLAAGVDALSYSVPCTVVAGTTYARFRLSSAGVAGPAGAAADGEVEDYAVNVGAVDFGDAPDSYGTIVASGGPNHRVVAGFSLGATVDSEPDGQPSVAASGDGADEDGVMLPAGGVIGACAAVNLTVRLTNTAGIATPRLDAWIDVDGDGIFSEPRDRVATGLALVAGANVVPYAVPCDAPTTATYARFRLSSAGQATAGGAANDGEVEDYALAIHGLDFGDAPDPTYPTLLASNGARHRVVLAGNPTLGALIDTEADGQPSSDGGGDDAAGDDEDGVVFPTAFIPGTDGSIELTIGATGGHVGCWIDFDRDGSWSPAEQVVDEALAGGSMVARSFPVPAAAPVGSAIARCRIATAAGLAVTGEAADGEVEDHLAEVGVAEPLLGAAKRLVSLEREAGTTYFVAFEVVVENLGNVPLTDVQVVEDLAAAFPGVAAIDVVSLASPTLTVNPGFDGVTDLDLLAAGNLLVVGGRGRISLALRIDSGGEKGPFENLVLATAAAPDATVVDDVSTDGGEPDPDLDGDPANDAVPTAVVLGLSVVEIPALGGFGLGALALLLALAAAATLRRHG